jgi:glucose-6-phosphate 1-epimerase
MQNTDPLSKFAIARTLTFKESANGLTKIIVNNDFAEAEIYLHGANLTHFKPKLKDAVIFNGKESHVTPPKSVHAGIPICWPWFGPHPTDNTKPQHGFARDMLWQLKSTKTLHNGTEIVLSLTEDERSLALWSYRFTLELTFTIGRSLTVELKTFNRDNKPFTITQALHSYFCIGTIEEIEILGVEGIPFIDYTDSIKQKFEGAPLHIAGEVNRVYIPTAATCIINDPKLERKIIIEKEHSHSTTIWNPWKENGIHDLPGDAYKKFVCIETTNALEDAKTVEAGDECKIVQKISVVSL